jgi:hypothetical protein
MDGNYTIDIDEVDSVLKGRKIYFDKLNNLTHNLKQSSYHFFTQERHLWYSFVLRYTSGTLGTSNFELNQEMGF